MSHRGSSAGGRVESGMTLLEVMIALLMLAVVSFLAFGAFKIGLGRLIDAQQLVGEQHNARTVMEWVTRRARMIGYRYEGTDPAVIRGWTNEVAFFADVDGDGAAECHRFYLSGGRVSYATLAGATCAAAIGDTPGTPLTAAREVRALRIDDLAFAYYSAATEGGKELPAPLSLADRFLVRRINVTARVTSLDASQVPFLLVTQAVVRKER